MPIPVITSVLIQAGIRLLSLIIDRARQAHDQTQNTIFHIIELWARSLLDNPASLRTAFDSAQTEFSNVETRQGWLQRLALLLEYGDQQEVATFADNLWRAYFFRLGSAAEALWNQYPDIQRRVYVRGQGSLPHAWGEWVPPITVLMGHAEANLISQHPAFERLLISADVFDLLEQRPEPEPEPEPDAVTTPPRPETFFMPAMQVDAAATLSTYLAACTEQVGMIDPRGYVRDVTANIPLQNIYVALRLLPLAAFNNPADYVRYQVADSEAQSDTSWLDTPVGNHEVETNEGIPVIDALSKHRLILILGGSGSGKTTLLYHVALEHVRALVEHQDSALTISTQADGSRRYTLAQPLPIYLDLADYVENRQSGESLPGFVTRAAANLAHDDNVMPLINTLLECGQCLLLLDGLDHVVSDEQRRMLGNNVSQAVEQWRAAGNQVVVSSRPDEFTATPLQGCFARYVIRPLGRRQISPFLMRWSLALTRLKNPMMPDDDALRLAESLTLTLSREITTNNLLGKLVNTPLMLRLLVGIYQPNMVFTPQRVAMIQVVADSMIREWRLPQSESHNLLILEHEANHILGELAFWIHTLRPSGVVDELELQHILSQAWSQIHPHSGEQEIGQAIEQFISHIRRYPGVLVEESPRHYRFIHQVVQEYFAARYLVSSFRRAAMRIRAILHNPRWLEVIRLAVSFLALRSREDASDLINVAILACDDSRAEQTDFTASPFEDILQRDLFRAASLLIYGTEVTAEVSTHIAETLMGLWLQGDRDDPGRFSLLFDKARRHLMALDGTAVSHRAFRIACEHLSNRHGERVRAFAIDALSFWPSHFREAVERLVGDEPDDDLPTLVRRARVGALGRMATLTPEAYRALIAMLNDQDEWVSNRSRQVLAASPAIPLETMSMWVDWLHGEPAARRVSLRTLRRMGSLPDSVISVLLHLLNNPDPHDPEILDMVLETFAGVAHLPDNALMAICRTAMSSSTELRCGAIRVLQRPAELPDEVVNYLIEWSYDPDESIREASTMALGACRNRSAEVFEALAERLNDHAPRVRIAAIEPLAKHGQSSPRIIHLLTHIAQDQDTSVRCALAHTFRHFSTPNEEIRRSLQLLLSDSQSEVREAALDTIGQMKEPGEDLIELLISMIDVTNMEVASKAVESLAALRGLPDTALLTLVQQALPTHWEQHGAAIRECLKAHTPLNMEIVNQVMDLAVIQPVGTAYYNRAPTLRICALEVLGYVMDEAPDAVSILLGAVRETEYMDVKLAALRGLGRARAIWPEVRETLLHVLNQGLFEVRAEAGIALGRLIGSLPDPPFTSKELEELAEDLESLVTENRPRASWESGAQMQDELLFALNAVVARIQHQPPRLPSGRPRVPHGGD